MKKSEHEIKAIFEPITEDGLSKEIPTEFASDTLSIFVDAMNSIIGGLIITNLEGIIQYANPSFYKLFKYSSKEIIGKNAVELFATKEVRSLTDIIFLVDLSKEGTVEFVVEKKDGTNIIVEVSASNVTSVSGELIGRMASFIDITKRKKIEIDREQLIKKLQHALETIKVLRGIIPICASCKKIRDDQGSWNHLESYLKEHSEAIFSHGICPDCTQKLYPDYYKMNCSN